MRTRTDGASRRRRATVTLIGTLLLAVVVPLLPGGAPLVSSAAALDPPVGDAHATVETEPVAHGGDAADDPAIWVHPTDPALSTVIGNDKGGALEVYDLAGRRIQRISEGFFGNVDVRQGVPTGLGPVDIAVVSRRGIRIYAIDPTTRQLRNITDTTSTTLSIATPINGEGLCLYRSRTTGELHVITNARDGRVNQHRLHDADGDGLIEAVLARSWDVGTETEGCVADDETGSLYISEEAVGVWEYGAEPDAPTTTSARTLIARTEANGGHISPDAEGIALVDQGEGTGYLIVSSQAASDTANSYVVYEREGAHAFVREFQVDAGPATDNCGRTDGIEAAATYLGPSFPHGIFICQDNTNTEPSTGNQNFKFVPLERVVGLVDTIPIPTVPSTTTTTVEGTTTTTVAPSTTTTVAPSTTTTVAPSTTTTVAPSTTAAPPSAAISFVASATTSGNRSTHTVTIPSTVRAGDALLLVLATNNLATIRTPTGVTGWTQLGTQSSASARSAVWRKVAVATDAGATVRVALSTMAKGTLAVVAYRGTAPEPVAAVNRASDAAGTVSHTSPTVTGADGRAWLVTFWTHKDSTTTALTAPSGTAVRSRASQSGSGRVTTLVVDGGGPAPAGSAGGLTASGAAAASNAHMWSILVAAGP